MSAPGAGSFTVTFTVSDPDLAVDSETITIAVTDTNRAPSFAVTPPTSTAEDVAFHVALVRWFADPRKVPGPGK